VLVDGSVDVPPDAGDLHVRLVHEPTVANRTPARPNRVREERREALQPPEDGDVIDLDAALGEEFLQIAKREAIDRYQRTATTMMSGGNRKPLNAELGTSDTGRRR
jgi:hypothetical protein